MKALYFDKTIELREIDEPVRKPREVLISVRMAGICNTDIEITRGYMGFIGIPGHEFVGDVIESDNSDLIGKRVVGEINIGCGECDFCRAGLQRHCRTREVLGIDKRNGAFAEMLVLPEENLHVLPDSIDDVTATFVEPVAACYEILEQITIRNNESVAIIGDGKLGALAAQVLRTETGRITVIGKHRDKLELIENATGIETIICENAKGISFETVVECSGNSTGMELAARIVKPRGRIVLKSTFNEKTQIDTAIWVINEISIIGSRCGLFGPAIKALEAETVKPLPFVEAIYPFDKALEAFEHAETRGSKKVILKFQEKNI